MILLSLLLACADKAEPIDSGEDGSTPGATWSAAFDTSGTLALSGVWGSGPDDVFICGGSPTAAEMWHMSGGSWAPMTLPADLALLSWVYGFGPDDVWSVGEEGGVVHWDGSAWTSLDPGTTEDLWGVFGFATDDLWIVGGDVDGGSWPVLLHYDGSSFTPYTLDAADNPHDATSVFKIWGIGGTLFAVGQTGLILRYADGDWHAVSGGAEADQDFVSLWGTAEDHIVAVGGRGNARVATWDGSSWSTVAPSGVGGLNAVSMVDPAFAVVGGIYGFVGTADPETGALSQEALLSSGHDVHSIWGDGAGRYYAVGGHFAEPWTGIAYVREDP